MSRKLTNKSAFLIIAICFFTVSLPVFAVVPKHWNDNTQAAFEAGTTDGTVVTNLGDIKLSGKADLMAKLDSKNTILYDMQYINDKLYLAAGPQGTLLRYKDKNLSNITTVKNEQIFSLGTYHKKLLVAISGTPSKLAVLDGKKLKTIATLKNVRYIWDTLTEGDNIIVASGTDGKILLVTPNSPKNKKESKKHASTQSNASSNTQPVDAQITTILDTKEKNIMCLGHDSKGRIYAGTDTNGIVYRLTKDGKKYDSYVLYQASEPEIDTLLVLPNGTVYAGTSNAKQARPGRLEKANKKQTGKPVATKDNNAKKEKSNSTSKSAKPATRKSKHSSEDEKSMLQSSGDSAKKEDKEQHAKNKKNDGAKKKDVSRTPTPKQYDKLRAEVQNRLHKAIESGELDSEPMPSGEANTSHASNSGPSRVQPVSHHASNKQGNAIYKITPQGFVHEIFRESVMILNIAKSGDSLIVTTGNQGKIYKVNPKAGETSIVAKLKPEQLSAIIKNSSGDILIGTANPATLVKLTDKNSNSGSYTSKAMDAKQISLWGKLNLTATVPVNSSINVETRSGNISNPDKGGWSKWSVAKDFSHSNQKSWMQPRQMKIQSPPARFLQYRLKFTNKQGNQPVVHGVNIAYVMPNLRPKVSSITGKYSKTQPDTPPSTVMGIKWKASDANDDTLTYSLDYRRAGSKKWINIKKNIDQSNFDWQTRQVPDGYYQLRVTASDSPDNPPAMALKYMRVSNPVLVDNTAPTITNLEHRSDNESKVLTINGKCKDNYSNIASIGYVIDSKEHYTAILPSDLIFDSTQERFHVKITNLKAGSHVVTLRVKDSRENTSYKSIPFTITNK